MVLEEIQHTTGGQLCWVLALGGELLGYYTSNTRDVCAATASMVTRTNGLPWCWTRISASWNNCWVLWVLCMIVGYQVSMIMLIMLMIYKWIAWLSSWAWAYLEDDIRRVFGCLHLHMKNAGCSVCQESGVLWVWSCQVEGMTMDRRILSVWPSNVGPYRVSGQWTVDDGQTNYVLFHLSVWPSNIQENPVSVRTITAINYHSYYWFSPTQPTTSALNVHGCRQ